MNVCAAVTEKHSWLITSQAMFIASQSMLIASQSLLFRSTRNPILVTAGSRGIPQTRFSFLPLGFMRESNEIVVVKGKLAAIRFAAGPFTVAARIQALLVSSAPCDVYVLPGPTPPNNLSIGLLWK